MKDVEELPGDKVKFHIVMSRKNRDRAKEVVATISNHSRVKSSNGQVQERYKVKTTALIGNVAKEIEVSLVCRKEMICRVLLGRMALESDFLVDSNATFIFSNNTN